MIHLSCDLSNTGRSGELPSIISHLPAVALPDFYVEYYRAILRTPCMCDGDVREAGYAFHLTG